MHELSLFMRRSSSHKREKNRINPVNMDNLLSLRISPETRLSPKPHQHLRKNPPSNMSNMG